MKEVNGIIWELNEIRDKLQKEIIPFVIQKDYPIEKHKLNLLVDEIQHLNLSFKRSVAINQKKQKKR